MSIPVVATGTAPASSTTPATPPSGAAVQAKAQAELNVSIVQASLNVSLSSQNDPLALVYKSAITSLNETLKSQFGEDAIQNAVSQDNTPAGTAGRIVSLSTAFYGAYKQQHPGVDDATSLNNFLDTIKGGVERGFKEARDILKGLSVLGGDIASNIDKTFELVQQGFADFAAAQSKPATPAATATATATASATATAKATVTTAGTPAPKTPA